ncbi:MAG TPA: hypothetical protein VK849_03370, partial [Longimicrobiales bacterium]|nr:hypothetical protein [Longimicrobiales bacterium]
STIRDPDQIRVLDHGRIVAQGTPDPLLSRDGLYRRLWEAQTGGGAPFTENGAHARGGPRRAVAEAGAAQGTARREPA